MRTSALLSTATKSWWWSSSSPRMQTPRLAISLARWNCATLSALSLLAPNNNLSYNIVSLQFFFCSLLCSCDALYFNNISLLVLEIPSGFVGLSSIFFLLTVICFRLTCTLWLIWSVFFCLISVWIHCLNWIIPTLLALIFEGEVCTPTVRRFYKSI